MKILLDESCLQKLRADFGTQYEVWTVRDKGWLGIKNGALLRLMTEDGFEVFVTVDRNLPYQQNLESLPVTIAVLCGVNNRLETLRRLIPKLLIRLGEPDLPKLIEIS